MAVNILNNIKEKGYNIQKIIMDDDATTVAKIRREVHASLAIGTILSRTLTAHCMLYRETK